MFVLTIYQNIQVMKEKYQGVWNEGMMGDYWILYHDDPTQAHKQKLYAKHFKIVLELLLIAMLSGAKI